MFVGLIEVRSGDPQPEQPWLPDRAARLLRAMVAFMALFVVGVFAPGWLGFACLWIATAVALVWAFRGLLHTQRLRPPRD